MNTNDLKKYIPVFEHLLSILIVFLLLSGTVVWSGRLYGRPIDGNAQTGTVTSSAQTPDMDQVHELGLPADVQFVPIDSAAWQVKNGQEEDLGMVIVSTPYTPDVVGFVGNTPVYLYVRQDTLRGISALDNAETPDFFRNAIEGLLPQFIGKSVNDLPTAKVDVVTGATYSSQSLIHNIIEPVSARTLSVSQEESGPNLGWGRTFIVLLVLALGLYAAFRQQKNPQLRLLVLCLNILVAGFWCKQFLSLGLLQNWLSNGFNPIAFLPLTVMLLLVFILPFLGRRRHYCQWICPYGSLQAIVWMIPVKKIPLSPAAFRILRMVRLLFLMSLLTILWLGAGTSLLDYEPFALFLVGNAAPAVVIFSMAFLLLGMFVPRPWCRALCPLGSLIDLSESGSDPRSGKTATQAPKKNVATRETPAKVPSDISRNSDKPDSRH